MLNKTTTKQDILNLPIDEIRAMIRYADSCAKEIAKMSSHWSMEAMQQYQQWENRIRVLTNEAYRRFALLDE